jgi:hypothetical protein
MSVLKRLWAKIARFAEALEGKAWITRPATTCSLSESASISLNATWSTSKGNTIRTLAAAGYSCRQ